MTHELIRLLETGVALLNMKFCDYLGSGSPAQTQGAVFPRLSNNSNASNGYQYRIL